MKLLRPPGALEETRFLEVCTKCSNCLEVCDGAIIMNSHEGPESFPHINPREEPCKLCMECVDVCPTGALEKVEREKVKMGVAVIDESKCFSYHGLLCGFCIRRCPLENVALTTYSWEKPMVNEEKCVGCGACEFICIHPDKAITVRPK